MVVVNACPLCQANEESVDHLLLDCKVTPAVESGVELVWVLLGAFKIYFNLLEEWKVLIRSARGMEMWKVSFVAIVENMERKAS